MFRVMRIILVSWRCQMVCPQILEQSPELPVTSVLTILPLITAGASIGETIGGEKAVEDADYGGLC